MEVVRKKRRNIPAKPTFTNFDVFKPAVSVAAPRPPTPPIPPPLAASASPPRNLLNREPLQPAQMTLGGLPLAGYPGQNHMPLMSGNLSGVQFFRCKCGLLLAESGEQLWWIPVASTMVRIENTQQLAEVLGYGCWRNRARKVAASRESA